MSEKPKVRTAQVGDKTIPVLVWPNGSHIHLMPWKIDGGQDPAKQLQRWVEAWLDHANQELQRWLNDEIEEATSDLRQHFVTEAERRMKAQNELDEAQEAAQWLFDKLDDGEWIAEALNKWTWLDLRDTSTGP